VVHYYLHPIYGIYQTAYGYTIGQNGTINVPGMPGTFITAPPGMTVGGVKITQEPNGYCVDASNITTPYPTQTR